MSGVYKDLSTIVVVPGFGSIPTRCVASWLNLVFPPNQKVFRLFALGMEVGEAFSQAIQNIVNHPQLSEFKYLLTLEHDNIPPPDGVLSLMTRMNAQTGYAAISGLYWTKGEGGVPQIWGDPTSMDQPNYRPQIPRNGELVECCGIGMGFALWRLEMFKDPRLRKPWFVTRAGASGVGTQDLYFWEDARKYGYRCAVDCGVPVGHYDLEGKFGIPDTVW